MKHLWRPANENNHPSNLEEYYEWQSKFDGHRLLPSDWWNIPFKKRERVLANLIWFFKFEISYVQKTRAQIKVIECSPDKE